MGRKKSPAKEAWQRTVSEVWAKHDFNAVDEMIKELRAQVHLKEEDKDFLEGALEDREVVRNEGGTLILQLKVKHRINLLSELAQYQHPKLRSMETKGQVDMNFNITIRNFEEPKAMVTDVPHKQLK